MKKIVMLKVMPKFGSLALFVLLASCGGSGSDSVSTTNISGSVVAAPVNGASVVIKDTSGNTLAGPVTSASDGSYSIDTSVVLPAFYIIESSGGVFADEATGHATTATMLRAYVETAGLAAGNQVHVTAASTIVYGLVVDYGLSLSAARTAFESAFGFPANVDVVPEDATAPAADASDEALLAGLRMAAFSQLTMDLGLSPGEQFNLLSALAEDLTDGSLDGEGLTGSVAMLPADIQGQFGQSLVTFHTSANNNTGLANDKIGAIPFAKTALTNNYKIDYVVGDMAAMEGKTQFQLHITDQVSGDAVTGLTVTLMPMMHMAAHMHSTPKLDCSDAGAGDYDCAVYYLMPSAMSTGMSMGYWELMVMAGMNESATFYPQVKMAMGDTAKAGLKGQMGSDMISGMTGEMSRNYYIFNDGLMGTGDSRTFNVFVSAMESMMNYPAVSVGSVLNSSTANELTVTTMSVKISSDEINWSVATDNGNGQWSLAGIAGLVDNTTAMIYVKLSINGEDKTMDGMAANADSGNAIAVFTVTPGGMMPMMMPATMDEM